MDYEKEYKKRSDDARYWHDVSEGDIPDVLEEIFPELRESEGNAGLTNQSRARNGSVSRRRKRKPPKSPFKYVLAGFRVTGNNLPTRTKIS